MKKLGVRWLDSALKQPRIVSAVSLSLILKRCRATALQALCSLFRAFGFILSGLIEPSCLKRFVVAEVAPLAGGEVAEHDLPNTDALEADDLEADELAHAADLALLAFVQNKA